MLAWGVGLACVVVSYRRWRQVGRLAECDGRALMGLRRLESLRRLAELSERLAPDSPVRELFEGFADIRSEEHGIALVNEASHDVSSVLDDQARVPAVAARIALATATLAAIVVLASSLAQGLLDLVFTILAFAGGVSAALVCGLLARGAERSRQGLRELYSRLFETVARLLPGEHFDAG